MNKILVVAAHPDDELLGVGGTIRKHVNSGDEVRVIIACEGESIRYKESVGQEQATDKAAAILGISKVYRFEFPDQRLDTFTLTEIITPIEKVSEEYRPNIVYCQSGCDANRDHKILFEAANIAFRPTREWIREFYTFYTASSTEWGTERNFVPDTWIDISETIEDKLLAFEAYFSEVNEYPHPRSTEALRFQSHFWGNQSCMDSAEVFETIRKIIRK